MYETLSIQHCFTQHRGISSYRIVDILPGGLSCRQVQQFWHQCLGIHPQPPQTWGPFLSQTSPEKQRWKICRCVHKVTLSKKHSSAWASTVTKYASTLAMKARPEITHPIEVGITLKITALKMIKLIELSTLSRYLLQQVHHHFQHHLMQDHVTGLLASAPARCRCSTSMEPARDWLCTLVHRSGLLSLVASLTAWPLIGPGWQDICRLEQYTPSPECQLA